MAAPDLSRLDSLADLGLRGGAPARASLLRVLTDLYVQKITHTTEEERHYTELALRLLPSADAVTRDAVASTLAGHLSPPLQVMRYLISDLPEITPPLPRRAWQQVTASVDAEPRTVAFAPIAGDASDEDRLAALRSMDCALAAELNHLFFSANVDERRLILLNLEVVSPIATDRSRLLHDPDTGMRLEAAALAGNREDFAQDLTRSLQIPRGQARRIVDDNLGEPVLVAAKALGVARDVLYCILLFLNPAVGHSVERVRALAELYDGISPRAAEGMVAIWQSLPVDQRPRAKHQPLAWDDTRSRPRPEPAAQRQPAAAQPSERRSSS
jgi:hypothetical protein